MKYLIGTIAVAWILGQTAAPALGLPQLGGASNLTALGLSAILVRWLITEMSKDREESRKAAVTEHAEAREHTERVVKTIAQEHQQDRQQWSEQLSKCRMYSGD